MKISIEQIFKGAGSLSFDEEGVEADLRIDIFNTAYELFLNKFDAQNANFRAKPLNFTSIADGNSIVGLGEGGKDDFYRPIEVRLASDKTLVDETKDFYTTEKTWYINSDKIYFLNYDEGTQFIVRYLPQFVELTEANNTDEKVWIPSTVVLPEFRRFINAIFEAIEDEPNTASQVAPLIFDQYFQNLDELLNSSEQPKEFSY